MLECANQVSPTQRFEKSIRNNNNNINGITICKQDALRFQINISYSAQERDQSGSIITHFSPLFKEN